MSEVLIGAAVMAVGTPEPTYFYDLQSSPDGSVIRRNLPLRVIITAMPLYSVTNRCLAGSNLDQTGKAVLVDHSVISHSMNMMNTHSNI